MKRLFAVMLGAFFFFLVQPPDDLSGQVLGHLGNAQPGDDIVSVGLVFGQMGPQTRFRDGGGFDSSTLGGATLNFWLHRHLGLQLNVLSTKHETLLASDGRASIVSGRDPRIWTYQADLVVRYPLSAGALTVSPYAALGGGWKTYRWGFDPAGGPGARGMDGAWSYVGGLEARFGQHNRFGLRGEVRELRTAFTRFGEDLTHEDRVLTLGLLMNF